jgi:proteasome lid subunit RPN8/RPN11
LQKQSPTEEICGVLIPRQGKFEVMQLTNNAVNKTQTFSMEMAKYSDESPICWHTHPGDGDMDGPSDPDKYSSAAMRVPICVYVRRTGKFHYWQPGDYHASILGRPWCPGIFDCFALIRDAIYEFWDVRLPDLDRTFLHASVGIPEIDKYFGPSGCELVHKSEVGRVAVMNHGGAKYPNHVALFIDKTSVLHQVRGQVSRIDFYSESLRQSTLYFMRHPQVEENIAKTHWQYGVKPEHRVEGAFDPKPPDLVHQPLKASSAIRQKALRGLPRQ